MAEQNLRVLGHPEYWNERYRDEEVILPSLFHDVWNECLLIMNRNLMSGFDLLTSFSLSCKKSFQTPH